MFVIATDGLGTGWLDEWYFPPQEVQPQVDYQVDAGVLHVNGTESGESIEVSISNGTIQLLVGDAATALPADGINALAIEAGAGEDDILVSVGTNIPAYVNAGLGNDIVRIVSVANDTITGAAGNDQLYGGDGNDRINGGKGNDLLYGENGGDRLYGGDGADYLDGANGVDRLFGEAGNDNLLGGGSNDKLYGGDGADLLSGGKHDDILSGDAGDDTLYSGDGINIVNGGIGTDLGYCGPKDLLEGLEG